MTAEKPGVFRRRLRDVPETLTTPITIMRRAAPDHGQFVVDALHAAYQEVDEQRRRRWRR